MIAGVHFVLQPDVSAAAMYLGLSAVSWTGVYFVRRQEAKEEEAAGRSWANARVRCCKCGGNDRVAMRRYYYAASFVVVSYLHPIAPQLICHGCRIKSGLGYAVVSLVFGWLGFPWGPIFTMRAVYRNCCGGEVLPCEFDIPAPK